jgi:hypothetical protein
MEYSEFFGKDVSYQFDFCSAFIESDFDKTNGYNSNMKFGFED